MSLLLAPLSVAMDPEFGVPWLRGKSAEERWEQQFGRPSTLREQRDDSGFAQQHWRLGAEPTVC